MPELNEPLNVFIVFHPDLPKFFMHVSHFKITVFQDTVCLSKPMHVQKLWDHCSMLDHSHAQSFVFAVL